MPEEYHDFLTARDLLSSEPKRRRIEDNIVQGLFDNNSAVDPIVAWLDGSWESDQCKNGHSSGELLTLSHGSASFPGDGSPVAISVVAGKDSDIRAMEMNGWRANGVRKGCHALTWYKESDVDSPIQWKSKRVPPRSVQTMDKMMEALTEEQEQMNKQYKKLKKLVRDFCTADTAAPCEVCLDRPAGVALLGCGHVMCEECAENWKACFTC
ncbi:unnamed protein product [Amoebophrya sp. A25]|nr:unnamed protein product [Amoebophrya sp. A25]|eukprot:GSA25T00003743001.1